MSSARSAGFTLVEMLVVLAVMTLVLAVVPSLLAGSQGKADVTAAAREIAAALREARSRALRAGHGEAFIIDGEANAFRIGAEGPPRHLPAGLQLSLSMPERRDVTAGAIRFFADGSSTGGRLQLRRGGQHAEVAVDWLSGRVVVDAQAE